MANFIGHTLPGVLLTILGMWWAYNMWMRYFLCQRTISSGIRSRIKYANTASFTSPCCSKIPFEGVFKATVVPIGMIAEYMTAFNSEGKFSSFNNLQHLTIYFFFALNGVMDILLHYKWPIPKGSDYASAFLGFAMEGVLFYYHLHGRSILDVQVHMLLLFVVVGCLASVAVEMANKHSVLAGLTRGYCVILQGTWLIQIGFILYSPLGTKWKGDDHNDMMVATALFCWHNAGIFVALIVLGILISFRVKNLSSTSMYYKLNPISECKDSRMKDLDVQQVRDLIEDSEEDEVV
ncbi:Transmembrane protein 45B [Halocaridina rubra]|uniref:Transmembrane protein 45B n=1 Tax=Halocaridina rubra TaxID=373956 RepID=A0AAN9A341_HALRR